jgi:hypothetical protein
MRMHFSVAESALAVGATVASLCFWIAKIDAMLVGQNLALMCVFQWQKRRGTSSLDAFLNRHAHDGSVLAGTLFDSTGTNLFIPYTFILVRHGPSAD